MPEPDGSKQTRFKGKFRKNGLNTSFIRYNAKKLVENYQANPIMSTWLT